MSENTEPHHSGGDQHLMFDMGFSTEVPDAHGRVYSKAALKSLVAGTKGKSLPVLDRRGGGVGVQIGGTGEVKVDESGRRVIAEIQLDHIGLVPTNKLLDPRCVVVKETDMEAPEPDVTRMLAEQELGGTKGKVEISTVEGGYIIKWAELILIPEAARKKDRYRGEYETVRRTAVRERLEDVIELVSGLLEKDRVQDQRGK